MTAPTVQNTPQGSSAIPSVPLTSEQKGKSKYLKPVLIGLGILFLVVISEASYLIVFHGYGKDLFSKTTTLAPTPTPTVPTLEEIEYSLPNEGVNIDKAKEFINILERSQPKWEAIELANLSLVLKGKVVFCSWVTKEDGAEIYSIDIESESGKLVNIALTRAEVEQSLTLIYSHDIVKEGVFDEQIKVGENIRIRLIFNALDTSPDTKVILEITRD
jgi:hypothetical protein